MDTAPTRDDERIARIRALNDRLRIYGIGGDIFLTRGVAIRGEDFAARAIRAVGDYDRFTDGSDPYEEHDFGSLTVDDAKLFFKVDYYDLERKFRSEDPADPTVTRRGLTEAQREEITAYVKEHVLQSYRNGVEKGRSQEAHTGAPQTTKPAPRKAWRPAKRTR